MRAWSPWVNRKNLRIAWTGVALIGTIAMALALSGQEIGPPRGTIGMAHDWSHRHVIFSNPATVEQGMRVRQDPRFWQQYFRRTVPQVLPAAEVVDDDSLSDEGFATAREDNPRNDWFGRWWRRHRRPIPRNTLKRDWSISLGPNATVGAGNYPAKFSFDVTTANCGSAAQPDFVVYNTSVLGSSNQASVVAYDNLYTGCGGTVPTTFWSYNTGGSVVTSVVLSLDGSQIAFIQTGGGTTTANLVFLKWKASTSGATSTTPDPITSVAPSLYPTCAAPCMTTLAFSGAQNDTNSSPFYDYFNDALYVGDNNGSLHKFQPVFTRGIPAEVGGSWPVSLAPGLILSSPVLDSSTGRVFVGSGFNGTTGGQLFSVVALTGSIFQTSSPLARGNGIGAGPIVDSTAGLVYVFVGTDIGAITCVNGGGPPCSGVYQFSVNSISSGGREVSVSQGTALAAGFPMYLGAFDNSYYTSANTTGSLYVCGQEGGRAQLFKIPITFGFMSPPSTWGLLAGVFPNVNIPCSPITEVFNPSLNSGVESGGPQGTDKIFVSTQGTDSSPCSRAGNGGCFWAFPATSWQPGTAYQVGQVILDDGRGVCVQIVTTAGTSNPTTEPNWGVNAGVATADGTVTWTGKTCLSAVIPPQNWVAGVFFGVGFSVLDPNGNIEAASLTAQTGLTQPTWPLNIGAQTVDGSQIWVNVGHVDVFSLQLLGGTSGIVVDNTVLPGTLAGASQIYFSPLGTGFGTCGAGNGCAVQASQAGLN